MKGLKYILASLAVTLIVCAVFAPGVFRHGGRGIPYSFQAEPGGPIYMEPGDHLQLLYHFWLLADSLWGETALSRNPYEFNTGPADGDPVLGGAYYAPFGPVFALLHPLVGRAAAWNLTGFLSLWIGYGAMLLLLRRHVSSGWIAALGALPVLMLPYRWLALLGGSPTGFAMMWPPVILLGIDIALRDRRLRGAWLAGLALWMAKWGDTHVFFFSFLAAPAWCLLLLVAERAAVPPNRGRFEPMMQRTARSLRCLWPLALCMLAALGSTLLVSRALAGSMMESGRTPGEVLLFTPVPRGLISWHTLSGHDFQIYLGRVMLVTLAAGLALRVYDAWRDRARAGPALRLYVLLLAAAAAVALLSLGPRMPFDPHQVVFRTFRRLVPPYRMIRQTAKIYAILPPLLALLFGLCLARLSGLFTRTRFRAVLPVLLVLALTADYARRIRPAICLLATEQQAYAAVVADAAGSGRDHRALALPLWPGDSHWGSLYEHYASLYRIRMVNGYSPVVARDYIEQIFEPFYPFNIGYFDDDRLDELLSRNIGYLLLHEDAFPEKVSPFPVVHTLAAALAHPRLQFLARDHAVWAFRIAARAHETEIRPATAADAPRPSAFGAGTTDFYFPARIGFAAFRPPADAAVRTDRADVSRGRYLRLSPGGAPFQTPLQPIHPLPGLRYFARVRGQGGLRAVVRFDGLDTDVAGETLGRSPPPDGTGEASVGPSETADAPGAAEPQGGPATDVTRETPSDWTWIEVPLPAFAGYRMAFLELAAKSGHLDLDVILLGAGHWPEPQIGQPLRLPAAAFFRAGYSLPESGGVVFERRRVRALPFYGPNHVLAAGRYDITLTFESPAETGTPLGRLRPRFPLESDAFDVAVVAGHPCRFSYVHDHNLLFGLELEYSRRADLTIHSVTIERRE